MVHKVALSGSSRALSQAYWDAYILGRMSGGCISFPFKSDDQESTCDCSAKVLSLLERGSLPSLHTL